MATRDPERWMWAEALDMLERAERMHRQFFQLGRAYRRPVWEPPVDVFETEEALWILVALIGVRVEQLEVVVDGGVLTVAGERRLPEAYHDAAIHRMEIPHGRFERHIRLPPGRFEMERRDLAYGCLTLSLRKLGQP